ncbi:ABC transporter ATP-binding protein [Corynebacterium jeikeium]|uniref:Putative ABC transport system, ATP-binding protein n=1 Tax=Corynebacterium jeikeium (strain K411) TaxID=306537 RepID=Q4JX71_CORJK|nr:ATP-binding cassette domain-containing protein [Corynebacterium jeikeium]EEW15430.1 ABC transporter, ATP-binding protein [Corynebacterium jeikeium ATCC 43734]OOD34536.1 ABC transporter ATP-binding protein [Corynebacterium jeikeium]WCZ52982.1 ABC-type transporter ATP-binding protein EcsA [Corynebacterium jeikeium]CAI36586.1 putative ABC transport system, ATP-binding protein [Corynebacterium jeikeium K411]SQI24438.1 ABC transporter ATP-binding protein [Corynebacterium jeikeium]
MEALYINNLNKSYGDHQVLHDMTLQVQPGEMYGFVGSNGAGKSTTMRIALGVLAADSGEVRLGDKPIDDDLRRRIGYMPEERGLYAKEKIGDQLRFFARLHGLSDESARKNAEGLLEQLGLAERSDDKLEELSLGNQQRVQLAASLIHDPELLILDEPFSGLDPVAVNVMSDLLVERCNAGVPVLFSSHQLDLVQRLCDRVGIIAKGRMKAEGTVDELRTRGPIVYEVRTPARDWYPQGTRLVEDFGEGVLLEAETTDLDQQILQAALAVGPVHSFSRRIPHLAELFQEVVES